MTRRRLTILFNLCVLLIAPGVPGPQTLSLAQTVTTQEDELFYVAQKAFDDGFYDVSIRYIEQFLQRFPSTGHYTEARLLYGQCYFFKHQYLKAFDIFQSLAEEPKRRDATLYWLGETYLKGSDYRQAYSCYRKVVDLYPDSEYAPQALYSLGWSFYEQGDYAQASGFFLDLSNRYPDHKFTEDALFRMGECYLNQSNYDKAEAAFENYVRRFPQSDRLTDAVFYIAESCYYADDLLKANTYYARAAEDVSHPRIAFLSEIGMGWIYLKLKKYPLSETHFDRARKLAAQNSFDEEEILLGEGALQTETERYHEALESYQHIVMNFPQSIHLTEAMLGQANALYLLQNYPESVRAYQDLLTYSQTHLLDDNVMQKVRYGMAWSYLKQGDLPQAIKAFNTILNTTTSQSIKVSALTQMGDAYQEAGHFAEALTIYDRVLNDFPESAYGDYAQFQQGITLLKMGDVNGAKISFQSLQSNFTDSHYAAEADYYLGFAHYQNQEWAEAIRYIQNFLNSSETKDFFLTQAQYILALSQFHLKAYAQAMELFQLIAKDPAAQPSIQQTAEIYIGKCLFETGSVKEAIHHFQTVIKEFPLTEAHQDALLWLGNYFLDSRDYSAAITAFSDFADAFPGSRRLAFARYNLGQCYLARQEYDKALFYFEKITDDTDAELFARARLAIADIFSIEMSPAQALERYRQVADRVPAYKRDALMKIARIHEQHDRLAKAIETYQEALAAPQNQSSISDAEILFDIADKYELLHQPDLAVEHYLKIPYLQTHETAWMVRAYLRVARIFEDQEDWDEAKAAYTKVLELETEESKFARERINWINQQS